MKSISVYVYKPVENVIEEIAKDYNSNWMNSVRQQIFYYIINNLLILSNTGGGLR